MCVKIRVSELLHMLQGGKVLVVRKGHGSVIVLKLKQFIVIWIFLKTKKLYDCKLHVDET